MDRSTFYLGCSNAFWLHGAQPAPLFVALHRLDRWLGTEDWPRVPACSWALDSGGFNEVTEHGRWRMSARDYCERVWSHDLHMAGMVWAAPQDWMCEAKALAATGLTVPEHQRRTVANLLELRAHWADLEDDATRWLGAEATPADRRPCPFVPVVTGQTEDDFRRCVDRYAAAGVDLAAEPLVGVGSICRDQRTARVAAIIELLALDYGLRLHGFGVKAQGLAVYGDLLASADSHAWSYGARRRLTLCRHGGRPAGGAKWERNCRLYALEWRERVLATLPPPGAPVVPRPRQRGLW